MTTLWNSTTYATPAPAVPGSWDAGISWRSVRTVAPVELPVSVDYIRDQHLRVTNGFHEDQFIERAIKSAAETYEHESQRALMLQTWQQILSGSPASGRIELVRPPFVGVVGFDYYDGAGEAQSLAASPAEYLVVNSGPYAPAELRPLVSGTFPTAQARQDALTITFQAGYATAEDVPESIVTGIALFVGELYKQRSLSQVGTSIVAAPLNTSRFWPRFW